MRITIVSLKKHWFDGERYYTYGGFGDYVRELSNHFSGADLIVPVYRGDPPEGSYVMSSDKIRIKPVATYENELGLLLKFPLIFLQIAFRIRGSEVVNIRLPDMVGVAGWIWCRLYGIPNFVSVTSDMRQFLKNKYSTRTRGLVKKGLKAWIKLYLFWENLIVSKEISFLQGRTLKERYKDVGKSFLWISSSLRKEDILGEPKFITDSKELNLLCVSRITRAKGLSFLIKSLHELRDRGVEARLTLVGKAERDILDELFTNAKKSGIEKYVEYKGLIPHGRELYACYDKADIFVLPSLWEGTPKVLLEAMARGIPIVASDVGGVSNVVVNGENGIIVPPGDPEEITSSVIELYQDKALRRRMSDKNREKARRYVLSDQVGNMMTILKDNGLMPEQGMSENAIKVMMWVSHAVGGVNAGINGTEYRAGEIAKQWDRQDIMLHIFYYGKGRLNGLFEELDKKGKIIYLPYVHSGRLNYVKALRSSLKKTRPDVLHVQGPVLFDFIASVIAPFYGVKALITRTSNISEYNVSRVRKTVFRLMDKIIYRRAERLMQISEHGRRQWAKELNIPVEDIKLVRNGVYLKDLDLVPPPGRTNDKDLTFGCISQLKWEKGFEYLFEAMAALKDGGIKPHLLIAGDGPERASIESRVEELGIHDQVKFLGFRDDIPGFLGKVQCIVLSSLREGAPVSLMQAASAGRPVIATDVGAVKEIVRNNETGILVKPGSSQQLAEEMKSICLDSKKITSMGKNAKEHSIDFDIETMISGYINEYIDLTKAGNNKKVYVVNTHGIGDVLMSLPMLMKLRELHPESKFSFLVKSEATGSLLKHVFSDSSIFAVKDIFEGGIRGLGRYYIGLLKERFDILIVCPGVSSKKALIVSLFCRAKVKVGEDSGIWSFPYNRVLRNNGSKKHKVLRQWDILELLDSEKFDSPQRIRLPLFPEDHDFAGSEISKLCGNVKTVEKVGIAPGSGQVESHKRWPAKKYGQLIKELLDKYVDIFVFIFGDSNERSLVSEINDILTTDEKTRCIDLVGKYTIMQSAALLGQMDLVVANCNGLAHLASSVGTKVVGLYGPTDPGKTGIFADEKEIINLELECAPCYRRGYIRGCGNPICIQEIKVAYVADVCSKFLGER